jgi:tRNA A37 threonylcarbamoyladenosine synthetase subunit TsaC/SUA5/YrdC
MIPATVFGPTAITKAVPKPVDTKDLAYRVPNNPSWLKLLSVTGTFSKASGSPVSSPSMQVTSCPLIMRESAGIFAPFSK